jgi:hypothetical protein
MNRSILGAGHKASAILSARASTRPASRLIVSLYLVGACTGRSGYLCPRERDRHIGQLGPAVAHMFAWRLTSLIVKS